MKSHTAQYNEQEVLNHLKHYLPSQAPLKDFVHHNTLHAFQYMNFHEGVRSAAQQFGYKVYLPLEEYRNLYHESKIEASILEKVVLTHHKNPEEWKPKLLFRKYDEAIHQSVGKLRSIRRQKDKINLDKLVQPTLFRLTGAYIDQGISMAGFPAAKGGLLASVRKIEKHSLIPVFTSEKARNLLLHTHCKLEDLLALVVGDEQYFEQYLLDQQFAHPGWSGMVAFLEDNPQSLLSKRKISLKDFIALELLLEIDFLEKKLGNNWKPLSEIIVADDYSETNYTAFDELFEVYKIWQEAYEWSYYDKVLSGLKHKIAVSSDKADKSFQALFCIDDRECSIRRYLEKFDKKCSTFGTAGFFNVVANFQPEHGKFFTKVCPAPVTPKHIIKESESELRHKKDRHFHHSTKGVFRSWLLSQTMGLWAGVKLALTIFKPSETPAMVSSFKHMDKKGKLSVECHHPDEKVHDLQVGFTVKEMTDSVEGLLRSIGLIKDFAPFVYVVGHGASSVNNTHYAGYDCGACSGRAGSVNARASAFMANHIEVRKLLAERGIAIPETTQFVGALHDTTRDEIEFYDTELLSESNLQAHRKNEKVFEKSLHYNAKERSRRFLLMDTSKSPEEVHEEVKLRALSLFEPRPEWNHATNALCIVGRRDTNKHLFLDRRSFLNSYDYSTDLQGKYLQNILNAVAPVCGGINLEYYFSRVDNYRLGAGSKLPHNIMGLIGVTNGIDGDLRTGLPMQMVNIHDPLRLLVIVEHYPEVVLSAISSNQATYEWFQNNWVHLVAIHPESKEIFRFQDSGFSAYAPESFDIKSVKDMDEIFESEHQNLPVYIIQ